MGTRTRLLTACVVLSAALLATLAGGETVEPLTEPEPEPVKGGPVPRTEPEEAEEPGEARPAVPVGLSNRIAAALGAGTVLVVALAVGGRIFARGRSARRSGPSRGADGAARRSGPSRGADGAARSKRGRER